MRSRVPSFLLGCAGLLVAAGCRGSGTAAEELPFEIRLEFEGEESVSEEQLAEVVHEELVRLEVSAPDKAAVDDAAFALELYYRRRGHAQVLVEYEFAPGETARARFRIEEGPVVRVRELVVEGPAAIDERTVRSQLGAAAPGRVYDELRLEQSLDRLRGFYLDQGFLRVEIDAPEVTIDAAGEWVTVRVALREGPHFVVTSVDFQGGVAELAGRESRIALAQQGHAYKPVIVPEIEHALGEDYRRLGYPDVEIEVEPELDEESGAVRIGVLVTPGERVTIAHFRIQGNERTRDAAILNVMGIERGERYDSERLREAFRELYATGLFESLTLELEGEGPERTLVVTVDEARSVQIRLEPGWGSYEGPRLLVGIEENNFQGRGQLVSLEGTVSLRAKAGRLAWVDRDFLGSRFTSETTFFVEQREEPSFEFVRRGFGFFLRRNWTDEWSTTGGYEFRPTEVTDDTFSTPLPPDIDTDFQVGSVSAALLFDDRDNLLSPTRGRQGRAKIELADDGFGSDTEFLRGQLEYAHLFRLGEETVLAASGRTGVISPFGTTDDIPLPERFFNGGENSVRSFSEDELLPPHVDGDPLGGEAATTLNLELRRILAGNLAAALFVDSGNVTVDVQDYLHFDGFRTGVGLGLRYMLPIGPVRVDLGVNPDPEDDEDEMVVHFSVGFPF